MSKKPFNFSFGSAAFPPEIIMSCKKILVVFGATGNQGGSVIKAILQDPMAAAEFQIHAITRDPSKSVAIALAKKGITVLKGDLDDKQSLRLVMKDTYAVFAVTNFFEAMNKDREIQQGKNIADVAKELDVKHLIWSSLPHVSKLTDNKLTKVLHFDSKAIVEEYIQSLEIPATFILLGIFMDYLGAMLQPISVAEPKKYKLSAPIPGTTMIPIISVESSTGQYVKSILLSRKKFIGKQICAAQGWYSLDDVVAIMRNDGDLDVEFEQCTDAEYGAGLAKKGTPEILQDDMSDSIKFFSEWGYYGGQRGAVERDHEILSEPLESLSEWVETGGLDYLK